MPTVIVLGRHYAQVLRCAGFIFTVTCHWNEKVEQYAVHLRSYLTELYYVFYFFAGTEFGTKIALLGSLIDMSIVKTVSGFAYSSVRMGDRSTSTL